MTETALQTELPVHTGALSMVNISKAFDGQIALDQAGLTVKWGELHALLGENGAGKSTLMNIACGLYSADSGSIMLNDQAVNIGGPGDATRYGIGMVHQHFKLVGPFSVAENILLSCGQKLQKKSLAEAGRQALDTAKQFGFSIDPWARTDTLSVAERQRIEIIKLILLGADILILDEPTAVLTDDEADTVLALLRSMAAEGKAVILITHRLREVTQYADRVTIMRGGKTVLHGGEANLLQEADLARGMVGETVRQTLSAKLSATANNERMQDVENAPVRLDLKNIVIRRSDDSIAVNQLSLQVKAGEILGIAGVGGNGQTELAEAVFGLHDIDQHVIKPVVENENNNKNNANRSRILIDDEDMATLSIAQRRQRGLRLVPADRFSYALLAEFRAYENLALTDIPGGRFGPPWYLTRGRMKRYAATQFSERDITGGTPLTRTRLLSGGNAQKLLLARELNEQTSVLIAHSPTRGLDVRAYQAVHETILASVGKGAACLLISEDLDEVLQLSTRIAVLTRGILHGPYPLAEINRTRIGELMAGHA